MALVIRYRCHTCGAHVDSAGEAAWVRCGHCRALVGYDWQAWFESQEYGEWLRRYPALAPGFTDFQKEVEAARQAAHKGLLDAAERWLRRAVDRVMGLTPQVYPPEVQRDPAYRQRYIRYDAWLRLQWMVDPTIAALDAEVQAVSRGLDMADPLPTLEKLLELTQRQLSRLAALPGAEDPDGMPPASRGRVWLSCLVSAYVPMLTPAQQLSMLRAVHGVNNVREVEGSSQDEVSLYFDWQCPRCQLFSLQGRGATAVFCPGCLCKAALPAKLTALSALPTRCGSCGHPVTISQGEIEVPCGICGARVRRIARTGSVERDLVSETISKSGYELPQLPEEGVPGVAVTPENRLELVLTGLARQANWYARLIQPSLYVEVVRRSLPGLSDKARAAQLERVAQLSAAEQGDEAAGKLLEQARALLLRTANTTRLPD
jgi:DNA-directed RNA polymerase subunit RPC12/RpoP